MAWWWSKIMQAYISGSILKIFFRLWSMIGCKKKINHWSKISYKILFWTKWAILAKLWLKTIQTYISGSTLRIVFQTLQHDKIDFGDNSQNILICHSLSTSCKALHPHVFFKWILVASGKKSHSFSLRFKKIYQVLFWMIFL